MLPCRYGVSATYEAVRRDQPRPTLTRRAGGIAIIRQAEGLRRIELDSLETRVLLALVGGATLGSALAKISAARLPLIRDAFTRWVAQGFFTALA